MYIVVHYLSHSDFFLFSIGTLLVDLVQRFCNILLGLRDLAGRYFLTGWTNWVGGAHKLKGSHLSHEINRQVRSQKKGKQKIEGPERDITFPSIGLTKKLSKTNLMQQPKCVVKSERDKRISFANPLKIISMTPWTGHRRTFCQALTCPKGPKLHN